MLNKTSYIVECWNDYGHIDETKSFDDFVKAESYYELIKNKHRCVKFFKRILYKQSY